LIQLVQWVEWSAISKGSVCVSSTNSELYHSEMGRYQLLLAQYERVRRRWIEGSHHLQLTQIDRGLSLSSEYSVSTEHVVVDAPHLSVCLSLEPELTAATPSRTMMRLNKSLQTQCYSRTHRQYKPPSRATSLRDELGQSRMRSGLDTLETPGGRRWSND
jgi:hypothetical protein